MAKFTVYVPKKHESALEELKEAGHNFSDVFIGAMLKKVEEIKMQNQTGTDDLGAVVARLRRSEHEESQAAYELGKTLGMYWARNDASLSELQGMAEADDATTNQMNWHVFWANLGITQDEFVADYTDVDDADGRRDAHLVAGYQGHFIDGFMCGARELYAAVVSQL